jgi:hypothetical protein
VSPYQTHQPLLFACARLAIEAREPVIELGCGLHSTLQLQAMCDDYQGYETDVWWAWHLWKFGGKRVLVVRDYDDVPVQPCGLLFIDSAPEERRRVDLSRFVSAARMVVVHDSGEPIYGMDEALALYPYRFDHKVMNPNTTLVSRDEGAVERIREVFDGKRRSIHGVGRGVRRRTPAIHRFVEAVSSGNAAPRREDGFDQHDAVQGEDVEPVAV